MGQPELFGVEGRAVSAHQAGDLGADDLPADLPLEAAQDGVV